MNPPGVRSAGGYHCHNEDPRFPCLGCAGVIGYLFADIATRTVNTGETQHQVPDTVLQIKSIQKESDAVHIKKVVTCTHSYGMHLSFQTRIHHL